MFATQPIHAKAQNQGGAAEYIGRPEPCSRISVVHVIDSLDVGGTETQMVEVVRRLDPRLYQVTVVCLRAGGPLTATLEEKGIPIIEFAKHRSMLSLRSSYQLLRLAWFLRRERVRVVHSHDLWANLMAVPAAWIAQTPVVISSQRNLAHLPWYTPLRRKVMSLIYRLSTHVIANSEAVRELLVEKFGVPSRQVHVFRNAVDFDRFNHQSNRPNDIDKMSNRETKFILNVANMNTEMKGHGLLIQAARTVCSVSPRVRFLFVGDGPLRSRLESQVQELQLQDHVFFLGRRKDVPQILSRSDLFVFPSLAEGLPNAILEAGASGLPIIATPVGGIPEIIIHNVTGLLVPPGDSQALAESILWVLKNPELASDLSRACQRRVLTEFSFDKLLENLN